MTMTSEVTDLATATMSEAKEIARDQYDSFVALIRAQPPPIGRHRSRYLFLRRAYCSRFL